MLQPLVSIVIPVYNGADYLKDAIDSALNQTYPSCEVLVINDGSNDNGATEAIALAYGNKIRYFYKENGGVASALNIGITNMNGEYFSWLSHDDIYYSNKVEQEVAALQQQKDSTRIVFSDYDILNMDTKEIHTLNISNMYSTKQIETSIFPVLHCLVHGCTLLIHKSHFDRIGLFDETLITTQDYDMWFRMFRNQQLVFINQPLIINRLHQSQGSRVIKTHLEESGNLHIRMMGQVSDTEINSLYGNRYMFYYKMATLFERIDIGKAYTYAYNLFMVEEIPYNLSEEIKKLRENLINKSNGIADKVCIFCAGEYGINLYEELFARLLKPDFFSDNNPKKWGSMQDGMICLPPDEIDKEKTLIIVSIKEPIDIINQLKEKGFLYIITKKEVEELMETVPPIKWIINSKYMQKSEEKNKNTSEFNGKYNQLVYEICQYYERSV